MRLLFTFILFFIVIPANYALPEVVEEGGSSSITVITADEIAKEKPGSIIDLLRQKVGIDESGSQVNMRGVKGVVVVIDGIPGTTIPSSLKPEDVEKIEILRGAASSRYGASAMGGAIVIDTKKGTKKWGLEIVQGYGSYGRHYTKIIGAGGKEGWNLRISGENNVIRRRFVVGASDTPFSYMVYTEDDYSKSKGIDTHLGWKGEKIESDLNVNFTESYSTHGRPNWWSEAKNIKFRGTSKYSPSDWIELSSIISYDNWPVYGGVKDRGTGTDEAGLSPYQRTSSPAKTQAVELQTVIKKGRAVRLTFGLRHAVDESRTEIRDYYTDNLRFEHRYKLGQEAAFLVMEAKPFPNLSLDISGRFDRYRYYDVYIDDITNKIYGETLIKESFNPKIGFKWKISDNLSLRSSLSTGFIPPSPYHLYFKDVTNPGNQILNNPDLRPETSVTADIGIDLALPYGIALGITPFYTLWKNKVDTVYTFGGTTSIQQPRNIGESESKGFELQINERFNERWSAFFNYTLNLTEITKNEADKSIIGNKVPDMPKHKFNLGLSYQKKDDFNMKVLWRYVGSRFFDQKNTVRDERGFLWKRDAYSVLDLTLVKYLPLKKWHMEDLELTFAMENLFDNHYGKWFFYRDPGRVIRCEIALKF